MKMDPFLGTCGVKLIQGNSFLVIEFYDISSFPLPEIIIHINSSYKVILFSYRFSYIALCCLSLLHRLDKINMEKAVNYILSCKNVDGGFGCIPGGESHAGQSMSNITVEFLYQIFVAGFVHILCMSFALLYARLG